MDENNKLRIVLWGTGGFAESFMSAYVSFIHRFAELICVVEDCEERVGSFFFGYQVRFYSDLEILKYDFCIEGDYYHDLSFEELPKMFSSEVSGKFLRRDDYFGILIDKSGYLRNKKIVFIGDKWGYRYDSYSAFLTMDSYEFYEDVENIEDYSMYDMIFICPPMYISSRDAEIFEQNILLKIREDQRRKVVPYHIWQEFMTRTTRSIGKGEANPDKQFFVIMGCEGRGWAALLLHFYSFVRYAKKQGMIPVIDMKNFKTQYIRDDQVGKEDIWSKYFMPVSDYSLDEVYSSRNVFLCPREYLLHIKLSESDIKLNKETKDYFDKEWIRITGERHKKVLGVLYRGTDFYSASGHDKPYTVEYYFKKVDSFLREHKDYDKIFLATEVEEVIDLFKKRYGDLVCFKEQKRFHQNERRILSIIGSENEDSDKDSLDYLCVLYLFNKCDFIMGIRCGGTLLASKLKDDAETRDVFVNRNDKEKTSLKKYFRFIKRKMHIGEFSSNYKIRLL